MNFDMDMLKMAALLALAGGGIAYVFIYPMLSGENRADKRQDAFKNANPRSGLKNAQDPNSRRKQVESSLKEIANKKAKGNVSLKVRMARAGLEWSKQKFMIFSGIMAAVFAGLIFVLTNNIYFPVLGIVIGGVGFPRWWLGFLTKRRLKKFVAEFPNALDVITRGIKSGLPLGDCLRIIAVEGAEPVKTEFRRIIESQTMGLTVPEAIERLVDRVPITEANFFSIVIAIQSKAGGNLSEALGNLSKVLRERKKMVGKVQAMAMEAKASAAIIGILPPIVALLVYLTAPDYISLLWTTTTGQIALACSLCWMSIGILSMKKMINFDI